MSRPIHLIAEYVGAEEVDVFIGNNKEPHCVIAGASIDRLDKRKIEEYVLGCDWTDKGAPGYITPHLRCDEFLKS